jgi:regulator of protease activity HflC (stomatin/prohibitin superfamily)
METSQLLWFWIVRAGSALLLLIVGSMALYPQYNVYKQRLSGQAVLAHADAAREVQVRQAQGEKEAASLRAEAIKIVGQASKDFPEYRQQEFIGAFAEAVKEGKINQIIYVPTEANIPITETRRLPVNTHK